MSNKLTEAIISDVYLVDPHKIKFDEKLVDFNESKDKASYISLFTQIKEDGQTKPIYIRSGLVIDGRHRCQIAKELSIQVRAVDIDPTLPDDKAIMLANDNIFGSRNNSATQLAIKALMLVDKFKFSDIKAVLLTGLKDKKAIGYVRRIKASKYDSEYNIIETLLQGDAVCMIDPATDTVFRSKSIDKVKRMVAKLEELDLLGGDVIEIPSIDYDSMLETETAREIFWAHSSNITASDTKLALIGLLNKVYTLKQDSSKYIEGYLKKPKKKTIDEVLLGTDPLQKESNGCI